MPKVVERKAVVKEKVEARQASGSSSLVVAPLGDSTRRAKGREKERNGLHSLIFPRRRKRQSARNMRLVLQKRAARLRAISSILASWSSEAEPMAGSSPVSLASFHRPCVRRWLR